ncbi:MAG: DUF455 family protein [Planctomycetota bacterium]
MEIREFAEGILFSPSLTAKLDVFPDRFTDDDPGSPRDIQKPARPAELEFSDARRGARMPHPTALGEPRLRAVAHHIMANHELQALEVMAWCLLRFPGAPKEFRRGLVRIMRDEQRHTRLHVRRLEALGLRFGDRTVNGYVWKKTRNYGSVLDYLAGLPLTFESGNLDHTLFFAERFDAVGDRQGADLFRAIHHDEIEHVAFGIRWLRELKDPNLSDWEAYLAHLHFPLRPAYAKGDPFHREPREQSGMTKEYVDALERASADWLSKEEASDVAVKEPRSQC